MSARHLVVLRDPCKMSPGFSLELVADVPSPRMSIAYYQDPTPYRFDTITIIEDGITDDERPRFEAWLTSQVRSAFRSVHAHDHGFRRITVPPAKEPAK